MNSSVFKKLLNLVYTEKCAHCKIPCGEVLCEECFKKLKPLGRYCCECCGKPVGSCVCRKIKPNFERCISAFKFEDKVVAALIYKLKAKGNRRIVQFLSHKMAQRVKSEFGNVNFDYVTFVPMTKRESGKKGFDHARLLAKEVSKILGVSFSEPPFYRKNKVHQKFLGFSDRKINAQNAFLKRSKKALSGTVLLIDDVVTTASTLSACSGIIKSSGAKCVYCATAATSVKN